VIEVEQRHHGVEIARALGRSPEEAAVQEIRAHVEVGQEAAFLEHVADAALVRRHVDPCCIEKDGRVGDDAAAVRREEPGDGIEHAGLPGAGGPEERGDGGVARESDVQCQLPGARRDGHLERQACTFRRAARASHSESTSAPSESAMDSRHNRHAAESPPGTCVKL